MFTVKADPNYGQPWQVSARAEPPHAVLHRPAPPLESPSRRPLQMCPQRSSSGSAFIVDVNQVEAVPNPGDGACGAHALGVPGQGRDRCPRLVPLAQACAPAIAPCAARAPGPVPLAANGSSSHSSSTDVDAASTPARAPTPAAAPATPSPSPGQGASSAPRLLILTNSHVVRGWPSLPS